MNLTTDTKIFLGIIISTIVLVVGAVFFMSRGSGVGVDKTKVDQAVLSHADSWATGSANPKITIVEFSDFQCPYCKDAEPTVEAVMAKHSDEVRLIYRHYPLIQAHQFAMDAAVAAEAAGKQGQFWAYHNLLFENQPNVSNPDSFRRDKFGEYAKTLGLNVDQFIKDFESDATRQRVLTDRDEGDKIGINATPTFFVNGEKVIKGYIDLESTVENLLKK
jgi:protein-disulfide isomerase